MITIVVNMMMVVPIDTNIIDFRNNFDIIVTVIPMQRFAKTGRPVEARHSRAHLHSSTFRKY